MRAPLFRLPDGHARPNTVGLCDIICCEYNAMTFLLASTHCQGLVAQFWMALHLDAGVEAVHVTV